MHTAVRDTVGKLCFPSLFCIECLIKQLNCYACSSAEISSIIIHQIFSLAPDWSKRVTWANIPQLKLGNIRGYYSTNCNTIQTWSWCSRYLSSVGDGYPAIYVASYVGIKREVKQCRQKGLKMLRAWKSTICWIIKQLSCSISRNIVWF